MDLHMEGLTTIVFNLIKEGLTPLIPKILGGTKKFKVQGERIGLAGFNHIKNTTLSKFWKQMKKM